MLTLLLMVSTVDLPPGELLVVSGEWCAPCRQQAPIIARLEREGVKVHHVDFDRQRGIADAWRVSAMPTVIVLHGGKEFKRFVGVTSYEEIRSAVNPVRIAYPPQQTQATPKTLPQRGRSADLINWWLNATVPDTNLGASQVAQSPPTQPVAQPNAESDVAVLALACDVRIKISNRTSAAWGSGTIFNYGQHGTEIVTNKHVVGNSGTITIDDGTDYWTGVKCVEVWPGRQYSAGADDIAVVIAAKQPPASIAICDLGYTPVEPLYMIGNPRGGTPTVCKTRIIKRWNDRDGGANLTLDTHAIEGDSGGGVYDSTGTLIGVIWGDDTQEGGLAVDLTRSRAIMPSTRLKSQKSAAGGK